MSNDFDPTRMTQEEFDQLQLNHAIELGGEAVYFDPESFVFTRLLASAGEGTPPLMRLTKISHSYGEIQHMSEFADRVNDAIRLFNKHVAEPRIRWGFFAALANYLHHNEEVWAIVKEGLIAKAQLMNTIQNRQKILAQREEETELDRAAAKGRETEGVPLPLQLPREQPDSAGVAGSDS